MLNSSKYEKPKDYKEFRIVVTHPKNNKAVEADGLPAKVFKYGGEEATKCMYYINISAEYGHSMPEN